jgi:hypothetical protein
MGTESPLRQYTDEETTAMLSARRMLPQSDDETFEGFDILRHRPDRYIARSKGYTDTRAHSEEVEYEELEGSGELGNREMGNRVSWDD